MEYIYTQTQQTEISESTIVNIALENDKIIGARCFEYENVYVLAIITTPFYLKSERDKFLYDTTASLNEYTQKNIIVTMDTDIYSRINENMQADEKMLLYQKIVRRQHK